ncbi:MAG: hypothetical protein HY300_16560, partial [Verrucomicrobia bacterium]|nr:hypothetical protein [Verrucomicrobiota bacterium]
MTDLRFIGDWRLWVGVVAALAAVVSVFFLYRRETRARHDWLAWGLPSLRALAVALVVLMLTGPVLHHRKIIGELAHVLLFADTSGSMSLTDEQMEAPRKLFIAHQLGWLPPERFNTALKSAVEQLAAAQQATVARPGAPVPDPAEVVQNFTKFIEAAAEQLAKAPATVWSNNVANAGRFQTELVTPVRKLLAGDVARDAKKAARDVAALVPVVSKWEKEIRAAFDAYVARVAASGDPAVTAALKKFDTSTRWQRLDAMLTGGGQGLLARLAGEHNVELVALVGDKTETVWFPGAGKLDAARRAPQTLPLAPTNAPTNLSDPVRERLLALREGE